MAPRESDSSDLADTSDAADGGGPFGPFGRKRLSRGAAPSYQSDPSGARTLVRVLVFRMRTDVTNGTGRFS